MQGTRECIAQHLQPILHPVICAHALVTEKNRLICKGYLRYPCNFITEFQGRSDPAMKMDMQIFSECTQYGHKCIHFSRVTYERLAIVHFPCKCCKISPVTCRLCTCHIIHPRVPCIHINLLWGLHLVAVYYMMFK